MSDFEENIPPADNQFVGPERQFDLLVDGELSEADRRALLLQLEHEPDGWRRCALAFLEAQCWKAELGQITRAPELVRGEPYPQAESVAPQGGPSGRRQSWRQFLATTLAIAASFLLTLVVVRDWSGSSSHSPDTTVIKTAKDEFPLASRDASPAPVAAQAPDDWETVTLAAANSSDGRPQTFRVPALRRDTLDENMLENVPDAISPELQQAFERSGHRVVQQREIVPFQMKDGRRLVVPVDHVEIHYVGRPSL